MNAAPILLPVLVALTVTYIIRDKSQYAKFKALTDTRARQATIKRWVIESFLLYGLSAIITLLLIDELRALTQLPQAFEGLATSFRAAVAPSESGGFWGGLREALVKLLVPMLLFGGTASALLRTYRSHQKGPREELTPPSDSRDLNALLPRNREERRWTTLLSINAGLSEELFFRLAAPLLIWAVTGSPLIAVIAATAWFGMAHLYQGWLGILVTSLAGCVFMCIYLYSGSIWLVVLIHAVLDLNDLSFAPWYAEWLQKRSAAG